MMPSILFPAGHAERRTERGTFTCPSCRKTCAFEHVVVDRVYRVFAMRLPAGVYGEYIECAACLSTFRPSALAIDAGEEQDQIAAEYERALRRVLALLVISDGRIDEAEIRTMQRVYSAVTGALLSRDAIIAEAREVAVEPTTVARYLAGVVGYLNEHGKEQILRGAALITGADGRVHAREVEMVRRLGAVMHLDPERVEQVLRTFT